MRIVPVFLTLVPAASIALAQENVPPPPQPVADHPPAAVQPTANGPSLDATLKFIQDKVNQQGKIVYVETVTDSVTGESAGASYPAATADPVRRVSFVAQSAAPKSCPKGLPWPCRWRFCFTAYRGDSSGRSRSHWRVILPGKWIRHGSAEGGVWHHGASDGGLDEDLVGLFQEHREAGGYQRYGLQAPPKAGDGLSG